MAKQARSLITRDRIVESAALVFDRYGFAGTTLSDIVRQSGTTKGSVYFHFNSKEEVAVAVVRAQHERSRSLRSAVGERRGLESVIWITYRLGHQILSDPLVRAGIRLTLEQATISTPMTSGYEDWVDMISELWRQAVDDGDVHEHLDASTVSNLLVGAFTGIQLLSAVSTGRADLADRLRDMWSVLLPSFVSARKLAHFQRVNTMSSQGAQAA